MEEHSPKNTSFFQSKTFKGILYGIGGVIVLLLVFESGIYVGYQKAVFSTRWAQNYPSNFFPKPDPRFPPQGNDMVFISPHGAFGDIIKIDNQSLVVKGNDEAEKNILVQPDTVIEKDFDKINVMALKVGDHVIVFGAPNDSGQIAAKVIRVLPQFMETFRAGSPSQQIFTQQFTFTQQ